MIKKLSFLLCLIFFSVISLQCLAQDRRVSGSVRNSKGDPVSAATIRQVGTNNATAARQDGTFSLIVNGGNVRLEVSSCNLP